MAELVHDTVKKDIEKTENALNQHFPLFQSGPTWFSGKVFDSLSRGPGFEPH